MLSIDCRFPGGNIKVHDIQGDTVFVSPDLRDTRHSWFYWAFRVRGAAGRTLTFRFISDHPVGNRGPAISDDGRMSWRWTDEPFDQDAFRVTIRSDETYLALAPLYTQGEWERFLAGCKALPAAEARGFESGFITKSRKGRQVEVLHAGALASAASRHVVVTARHHCCEMIADWVMEGIASSVLAGDDADAAWLRSNVSFTFVPFVDKDGVEDGDQGKGRAPHDHNRDYGDNNIFPETAAVRRLCDAIIARCGRIDVFMDLHCPWIRGGRNESVFQMGRQEKIHAEKQEAFGEVLAASLIPGSLPYFRADNQPFATSGNSPSDYAEGLTSTTWAARRREVAFSTCFEIPYANAHDTTVTPDGARAFGRSIAVALARYLKDA